MPMRRRTSRQKALALCLLLLAASALLFPWRASLQGEPLRAAWDRAREAGAYRLTADVEQHFVPRPSTRTIGQRDERVDLRIDGEVTLPDQALLHLRFEGQGVEGQTLALVQEGGETFLLQEGERIPLENPAGLAAPTGDYLGYLAGAQNVRQLPSTEAGITRYAFEVNGWRFAEHVRQTLAAQPRQPDQPPLPPGVELSPSSLLQRMTGSGELWVGPAGLPLRQILDLDIPRASDDFDAQVHLVVDFSFTATAAASAPPARLSGALESMQDTAAASMPRLRLHIADLLCLTLCLALTSWLVARRRHRRVYQLFAISFSAILVLTPLLQAAGIVAFDEARSRADPAEEVLQELWGPTPEDTPTEDPEDVPSADTTADQERQDLALVSQQKAVSALQAGEPSVPPTPAHSCGDGEPGVDSDNDGLLDVTEYCLGTDPFYHDTDRDLITDTLEIEGFDYGGEHWPLDPFEVDSNHDGLADGVEWPAPIGDAPSWDVDGDGVPNLWDRDNDDDGVPDNLDLSPFSRTDMVSEFRFHSQSAGPEDFQYVELQLRPNNPDHLRYTTATLDWPYDHEGQIQDLEDSPDDMRLIPLLEVLANRAPDEALGEKYGLSSFENTGDGMYPYRLVVPLAPVGDGGQIVAWYTKVPYEPSHLNNIIWKRGRIIWVAQVEVDQWTAGHVQASTVPVQTYPEPSFCVTGFQVTRSRGFESAVIGTPGLPTEDRQLFNLLFGLSTTFLNTAEPSLQTVETRFTTPGTPPEERWGVSAVVGLDRQEYGHRDAGLAGTSQRVHDFLEGYSYDLWSDGLSSLIIAFEEDVGSYSLDDDGALQPDADFYVNILSIPVNTMRGLKLGLYAKDGDEWEEMPLGQVLPAVQERYADLSALLSSLCSEYPSLTEADLRGILYLFYATWSVGQSRVIAVEEVTLPPGTHADADVYDRYFRTGLGQLPAYLLDVAELGQDGAGLRVGTDLGSVWDYLREQGQDADELGFYDKAVQFLGLDQYITGDDAEAIVGILKKVLTNVLALKTVVQAVTWARSAAGSWSGLMSPTKMSGSAGRMLGAIGCAVSVGLIWLQFGLTTDFSDPIALKTAIVYAIVATVLTVVLFIISLNPVGAILVAVFYLIDLIVYIATWLILGEGISIQEEIIKALTEFFYSADVLTYLDSGEFGDLEAIKPDGGLVEGSTFIIKDRFTGKILRADAGTLGDLLDSDVIGWLTAGSTYQANTSLNIGDSVCTATWDALTCRNDTAVLYTFPTARRDARLEVESRVHALTFYQESTLGGSITWRKDQIDDLPDEDADDEPVVIYLDILPSSLQNLWDWADIDNPDEDADRLPTTQEQALGTRWTMWDTDCDGLSDKFEYDQSSALGAKVLQAFTDGDELADGFEYRIGTMANQADSDSDGLSDSEELYHQKLWIYSSFDVCYEVDQGWNGGWWITLPELAEPVLVLSNPRRADADGDGVNDGSERANGTSPHAFNSAPRLGLEVHPLSTSPSAQSAVWVETGANVAMTLTVDNVGVYPISDTLKLCLPDFLTSIQGGVMAGDSSPVASAPIGCANGLSWSFEGSDALQRWEQVTTVVTATVNSPASDAGEIVARLPFLNLAAEPDELSQIVGVIVDRENPWVTITSPHEGALLGRGTHSWVVGGAAGDDSSWITQVSVNLPGQGNVTATGTNAWAATWSIPGDGEYTLTATSRDYLNHDSAPSTVHLRVDNTPPEVALDLAPGEILSGQGGEDIVVELNGTATDNLSGLVRVQISLDGRPWREVWAEVGTPTAANWTMDWQMPNAESAQGYHSIAMRAFDLAGNVGDPVEQQVLVDVLPPTSELTRRMDLEDPPRVPLGQNLTFDGVANDAGNAPLPARPAELIGTVDSIEDATIWLGPATLEDNDEGVQVAWLGDFNGDRLADLAVGMPAGDPNGLVTVVYGRAGDWPIPPDREALASSPTSFVGQPMSRPAGHKIGLNLVPVGDVNGDGLSDLMIGDLAADRVYVIFGSTRPFGRAVVLDGPRSAVWSVLTVPGADIGDWMGAAGDVNGDGYDDLLVGASTATASTAYLLLGQASPWWDTLDLTVHAAARLDLGTKSATLTGLGNRTNDPGDPYDDFAVALNSNVYVFPGRGLTPRAGQVLALGDPDVLTFASADPRPDVVALGDVDNDERSDFLYSDGAAPKLVRGNGTTLSLVRSPAASGFLAAPGDVDADGLDDILVGNTAENAYLFLEDASQVVTIQGVQGAASTPYASGADLNSDGSSDLLLVPHPSHAADLGMTALDYGSLPFVPANELPIAAPPDQVGTEGGFGPTVRAAAPVTRYVDDDYCPGCTNDGHAWNVNAFNTITNAATAAAVGDTIQVRPGRYAPFVVNKNDLLVSGVHADAVFIDGGGTPFAAKVDNASGVTLENLTLRNAATGVYLDHAGVDGQVDTAMRTTLRSLLLHDMTSHGVDMDPKSTALLQEATLSTDLAAAPLVNVRPPEDSVLPLGQFAVSGQPTLSDGNGLVRHRVGIFTFLYAISGGRVYRCRTSASSPWEDIRALPAGRMTYWGDVLVTHVGELYAMLIEEIIGSPPVIVPHFYRLHSGGWEEKAALPGLFSQADLNTTRLASDGSDIYWLTDGWWPDLYRYDVAANAWTVVESGLDFTVDDRSMVGADGKLYIAALYQDGPGGTPDADRHIFEYDPASSTLTKLAPIPAFGTQDTMPMVWDGGQYIYGWYTGANAPLLRYDINQGADPAAWQVIGTHPGTVNGPARLARMGSTFYLAKGAGSTIFTFPPKSLTIEEDAFVADPTLATAQWCNLDPRDRSEGFGIVMGGNNGWAAGSGTVWSPNPYAAPITWEQAGFLDAARDIYRLGSASALPGGYHTYRSDATVSAQGGGGEFTSIQEAINSGANSVLIGPGSYTQPFYLLSGVMVAGSGAELTRVMPPATDPPAALVSAEAVRGATVAGLSLLGSGPVRGVLAQDGARWVKVSRNIIRHTVSGIVVSGADTEVEVVNNTIVGNTRGMVANSAPVDVRNTIFAHNSLTGLDLSTAVSPIVHRYNDFWENGTDLDPNSPDPSEMFLDPLFENYWLRNYRLSPDSPMIDAGNPTDLAPPGAGSRVDVGYHELGRAAFYVDQDYCWSCINDGLTWQLDAFDTIGGALDRARQVLVGLLGAVPQGGFTVAVAPGVYQERVSVPSYVHLTGGGAQDTLIFGGNSDAPVTFDGVVQAQVSGFTLYGGPSGRGGVHVKGGSNNITISRNVLTENHTGVRFDGRSSGAVLFNTIAENTADGVLCTGSPGWVEVRNNILYRNDVGLHTLNGGSIFNDYNLFNNNSAAHYDDGAGTGLTTGPHDVFGSPAFGSNYQLTPGSKAVDRADPAAPVPQGGGSRADIGCYELLVAPVTLLLGQEDVSTATGNSGVQQVQVGITRVLDPTRPCTDTAPSAGGWTTLPPLSGETTDDWQTIYTPAQQGLYRLYSRATDVAGNQETNLQDWCDGAFVADGVAPVVQLVAPTSGSSTTSPFELRGAASDYGPSGEFTVYEVYFEVDGTEQPATWAAEPWEPDAATAAKRPFRAWVSLPDGSHTVQAFARDLAGNAGNSALATIQVTGQSAADTTPPLLAVASPAEGGWVTSTVFFAGTTSDTGSGLASVEVSVDGGVKWMPAHFGSPWHLTWDSGRYGEVLSYPAHVRARDRAGNTTVESLVITLDNLCPDGPNVDELYRPPGWHWDSDFMLWMRLDPPTDESGTAEALLAFDQFTDTIPSTVFAIPAADSVSSVTSGGLGDWYLHLGARDAAGNVCARHYGPWHVGRFGGNLVHCFDGDYHQTIILDGSLDVANDEWRAEYELLDDDERPAMAQALYFTFDSDALFLGWQGAQWTADGALWAYLATDADGSTLPAGGLAGLVPDLPFAANDAVEVTSPTEGRFWHYSGGTWESSALDFTHGDSGGTEIRLPMDVPNISLLRLMAFAVDDDNQVWSTMPTNNALAGPWTQYFSWGYLCAVNAPNDGQPRGVGVEMALTSPQSTALHWGPNAALTYVTTLTNLESEEVANAQLVLDASTGLTYEGAPAGASCADCAANNHWVLDVPAIAASATQRVTVTGRLADAGVLAPLQRVTTTARLEWDAFPQASDALSHRADGVGPTVTIFHQAGAVMPPAWQTFYGGASDGSGSGVVLVEAREAGGAWQTASGTLFWTALLEMPASGTFVLEVRATDALGNVGPTAAITFVVDQTGPQVALGVPVVLTGTSAILRGTTSDPAPPGALVSGVAVQMEDSSSVWQPATGPYALDPLGVQSWSFTWHLPHEDNVAHQLRGQATDGAGNTGTTAWIPTTVDTVPPNAVVLSDLNLAGVPGFGVAVTPAVISGTVTDGAGVRSVRVMVSPPDGLDFFQDAQLSGNTWSLMPGTRTWTPGLHSVRLLSTDNNGNQSLLGPLSANVRFVPQIQVYSSSYPVVGISQTLRTRMRVYDTLPFTPTGTVQFHVDGVPLGDPVPVAAGPYSEFTAQLDIGPLAIGSYVIGATYNGNDFYHPRTATQSLDIEDRREIWVMTLSTSQNPSLLGEVVTFTAKVDSGLAGINATGTVQFAVDGTPAGAPVPLVGTSQPKAAIGVDWLSVGQHVISATYSGDSLFKPTSAVMDPNQQVNGYLLEGRKYRPLGPVYAMWPVWYYIDITNTTQSLLHNVTVSDTLPTAIGPSSVAVSSGGEFDGERTVAWRWETLGAGQSTRMWIRAQTLSTAAGTAMVNRALVNCDEPSLELELLDEALVHPVPAGPTPTPPALCPDPYEPNESFFTAWPLTPGSISSYLCCGFPADLDYFRFEAQAGERITLRLSGLPNNYNLCLYGPDHTQLACSRNLGLAEERIEFTAPEAGTHYARVYSTLNACHARQPYRLELALATPTLTLLEGRKYRPLGPVYATWSFWYYIDITNTTESLLHNVTVSDTLPTAIGPWSVAVSSGGQYDGQRTVAWRWETLGAGQSTRMWIRAQTLSTAAGTTMVNRALVNCDEPGLELELLDEAFVFPAPAGPTPTPPAICPDPYEPNESFFTAWPLTPGSISSYLCCGFPGDLDYFRFEAQAGERITLRLSGLPDNYDLCLYGPDHSQLACSRNLGLAEERIEFTALEAGTHYARVYSALSACNARQPYRLELALATPTVTPTLTATPTATGLPPSDLTLSGLVYDAEVGRSQPIEGATVAVRMCVSRSFQAVTGGNGAYQLLLPADYLNQCSGVTLEAWATGYHVYSSAATVADLRLQPVRDIGLYPVTVPRPTGTPTPTGTVIPVITLHLVYLPLVLRGAAPKGAARAGGGLCHPEHVESGGRPVPWPSPAHLPLRAKRSNLLLPEGEIASSLRSSQ